MPFVGGRFLEVIVYFAFSDMLFLFSSNISDELGFIIIDFDRNEPFDSTTRLVNVIVLPCGLAVTVVMAGVVWLAVAIE